MYTSPYLEEFEERIQINGENINKDTLVNLLEEVKIAINKVIEEGYEHPTEFEIITALMFLYFYNEKVDYGVVEVGLGGRLDSTNVLTPKVSVIASISLDHMSILGDNLKDIAKEKAGIIKDNVPVILYPQEKEVEEVILNIAKEKNSKVYLVKEEDGRLIDINYEDLYQNVEIKSYNNIYTVKLPLLGEHQILNLGVAINTIEVLCEEENIILNKNIIEKSLEDVKWMGRLEVLGKKPTIVIDGAHNIDAIKALRKNIERYFKYNKIYLLLGILADKQVKEMIEEITPIAEKIYALTPHSERAELSEDLKNEILEYNLNTVALESYEEAFALALKEAKEEDLILISGSLYMIGDMRKIINSNIK
jgi:dihydrofolate synthase/folylpolyglutamate synthase